MRRGFGESLEEPVGAVASGVKRVSAGVRYAGKQTGTGLTNLGVGFSGFRTDFLDFARRVPVPPSPKQDTPPPAAPPRPAASAAAVENTPEVRAAKTDMNEAVAAHVATAIKSMAPDADNPNKAIPVANGGDFDAQVQSRVMSSRPGAAVTAATDQLAEIIANTAATTEEVKNAVEVLEEIRDQLASSSGSSSGRPNTASKTKPRGTPNFYQWQFGRFGDTTAKQHTNTGV
jgi:hypothetical protein